MNRSLESLKTLLLQRQEATQRRVEKAEILEHTVLFLQTTAKRDATRDAGGGSQKHSFQDGFSTCLQRASQFLGPEGKGLWLGAALDASFAARLSRPDSDSAGVQKRNEVRPSLRSLLLRKSSRHIRQLLIQSRKKLRVKRANRARLRANRSTRLCGGLGPDHQAETSEDELLKTLTFD
ncbi:hypothetical protein ABVT39_024349 [Epinephelus coioides]